MIAIKARISMSAVAVAMHRAWKKIPLVAIKVSENPPRIAIGTRMSMPMVAIDARRVWENMSWGSVAYTYLAVF